MLPSFDELYRRLVDADESTEIEAKTSAQVGDALLKTVCAFANEPGRGGGFLLLGVSSSRSSEGPVYSVVGVPDPDKLQTDIANQCVNCFNEHLRPEIDVSLTPDGKRVLVVHVPESDPSDKPIYLLKMGLPKGAYRRIGAADHRFTDQDLALIYSLRSHGGFDAGVIRGASIDDIDREAVKQYRRERAALSTSAEELKLSTPDLLKSIGAAVDGKSDLAITRAGLLLFGKRAALRRLIPWARIDYVIVPGQEWVPDPKQRYRTVEVTAPLLIAIPKLVDLIAQDLPRTFQLKGRKLRRREIPAVPHAVIREAVVNAVMHREYRIHEHSQIIKFSNRIEIRNAGYSLKATERLGQPGSVPRNPCIAAVLHETGYAETKGTGILAMRRQMHDANLSAPLFMSSRDEDRFEIRLFTHNLLDAETVSWLGAFGPLTQEDAKALVVAREMGYIDNAMYRDANSCDTLAASNALRKLRDFGVLNSHAKGSATFYTLSPKPAPSRTPNPKDKTPLSLGLDGQTGDKPSFSPEIVALLKRLGDRGDAKLLDVAILRLCGMKPMAVSELSQWVGRHPMYLVTRFIRPLVKNGHLLYLYPETPSHPRQKYVTSRMMLDVPIPEDAKRRKRTRKKSDDDWKLF